MKWESALEEIKALADFSDFAIIVSYIANREFLESILECNSRFGKNMILITESTEQFWYPYEPSYTVISKHELGSLDPEKSLHAKVFMFGKSLGDGKYHLKCLVGSCNATVPGFCRNIELWASTEGTIDLSQLGPKPFLEIILDESLDLNLVDLQGVLQHDTDDQIVAPILDLVWRLVKDSQGQDSGLEFGKSECLSDRLVQENNEKHKRILVHTLGFNSLAKAIKSSIKALVQQSEKYTSLLLISPYHDLQGFKFIIDVCKEAIGLEDKRIQIRVLTSYPPDFENKYLSNETFTKFEDLKLQDERLSLSYRFWTGKSRLRISEIVGEDFKDISGVFLHGKALILQNDNGVGEAFIGSPNFTKAALSTAPDVNLEVAIWERDSVTAKEISENTEVLWNQSSELSVAMKERLTEWHNRREEEIEPSNFWTESSDAIKSYIKAKLVTNGHPTSERAIYPDETTKAYVEIQLSSQAPEVDVSNIKCVFLPNLKAEDRYETGITKEKGKHIGRVSLKGDPPQRVFYQVTVPTKFEKETVVKFREIRSNGLSKLELKTPPFNQARYKANILVKTSSGWKEFSTTRDKRGFLEVKIAESPTSEYAKLRLYGENSKEIPLRWDSFAFLKRHPEIILGKNCLCPSGLCFTLKEKSEPSFARILLETLEVDVAVDNGNEMEPHSVMHATNKATENPYLAQHYLGFEENPLVSYPEISLTLKFEDDNSRFRSKSSLYTHLCFSPTKREQPCELDGLFKRIFRSDFPVKTAPPEDAIVNKAPIFISIEEPSELKETLRKTKGDFVLTWNVSRWGRPSAKFQASKPISDSTTFGINPIDLTKAYPTYIDPLQFDGMLHVAFSIALAGWNLPLKTNFYNIKNTRGYINDVFGGRKTWTNTLKYIEEPRVMEKELVTAFYEAISQAGYEVASENQFRDYLAFGLSQLPGCYGHASVPYQAVLLTREEAYALITKVSDFIAKNVGKAFSNDASQPKIEFSFFGDEYIRLLRPAIFRLCCIGFDHQSVMVFPNLLFKELSIKF